MKNNDRRIESVGRPSGLTVHGTDNGIYRVQVSVFAQFALILL